MDNDSNDLCHREDAIIPVAAICSLLNQHFVNSKVCRTPTNCVRCYPSKGLKIFQHISDKNCMNIRNNIRIKKKLLGNI